MVTPKKQLKAAEKLAASFPLFAEQLTPELPKLKEQVKEYGNRLPPAPAKFKIGDRVNNRYWYYRSDPNFNATVIAARGSYDFNGVHHWHYELCYDKLHGPCCPPAVGGVWVPQDGFPILEDKLTLLPEPRQWT